MNTHFSIFGVRVSPKEAECIRYTLGLSFIIINMHILSCFLLSIAVLLMFLYIKKIWVGVYGSVGEGLLCCDVPRMDGWSHESES